MDSPLFQLLRTPDAVYVFLIVGIWTGAFALVIPGTGLLELASIFCLGIAAVAALTLPLNFWALLLLLSGFGFFLGELLRPRRGLLLLVSVVLFSSGSILLFRGEGGSLSGVSWPLAIGATILTVGFFWFVVQRALLVHRMVPDMDLSRLIGARGLAVTDINGHGSVQVASEQWSARSARHLAAGTPVVVVSREGLVLTVESAEAGAPAREKAAAS